MSVIRNPRANVNGKKQKRKQKEKRRTVRVIDARRDGSTIVRITQRWGNREECFEYFVDELPPWSADGSGRSFVLSKREYDPDREDLVYHVHIENGQDKRCECKGFEYRGTCKHVDAMAALLSHGKV